MVLPSSTTSSSAVTVYATDSASSIHLQSDFVRNVNSDLSSSAYNPHNNGVGGLYDFDSPSCPDIMIFGSLPPHDNFSDIPSL